MGGINAGSNGGGCEECVGAHAKWHVRADKAIKLLAIFTLATFWLLSVQVLALGYRGTALMTHAERLMRDAETSQNLISTTSAAMQSALETAQAALRISSRVERTALPALEAQFNATTSALSSLAQSHSLVVDFGARPAAR